MKNVQRIFCVGLAFSAMSLNTVAYERESHGGNFSARAQFVSMRSHILASWTAKTTEWLGVTKDEFEIKTADVEVVDVERCLDANGKPNGRAAQNYMPDKNSLEHPNGFIEVGEDKWPEYEKSLIKRYFLVLHEFLSFLEKDRNYELTKNKLHDISIMLDGVGLKTQAVAQLLIEQLLLDVSRKEEIPFGLAKVYCPKNAKGEVINRAIKNCQIRVAITQSDTFTKVDPLTIARTGNGWNAQFEFQMEGKSRVFMAKLELPEVYTLESMIAPALSGKKKVISLEISERVEQRIVGALEWLADKVREEMGNLPLSRAGVNF